MLEKARIIAPDPEPPQLTPRTRRPPPTLTPRDHSRDSAGLRYVYPVISRRAGGVSVGINLNPNNACNWRCIYCQVPDLKRGAAPRIDLELLESELSGFLKELLKGAFMEDRVPTGARRLNDIALSGNGEPTTSRQFPEVVELIGRVREKSRVSASVKTVLITNGSMMDREPVRAGVARMAALNGEVWFKVDRATPRGMLRVNGVRGSPEMTFARLAQAAGLCPTWVQTCVFRLDNEPPDPDEREAYLGFLRRCVERAVPIRGVLLYGLARPSMQPEAARLSPVSRAWLDALAGEIEALGLRARTNP